MESQILCVWAFCACMWLGLGFYEDVQLIQTNTQQPVKVRVSQDASMIFSSFTNDSVNIYQFVNGEYQLLQEITNANSIIEFGLTADHTKLNIHTFNTYGAYEYSQTTGLYEIYYYQDPFGVTLVKANQDITLVAMVYFSAIYISIITTQILMTGFYQLTQIVADWIQDIEFRGDTLICAGSSGIVYIYKQVSGIYTFQESFTTGYYITDLDASEDLSQILVKGTGVAPQIYKKIGGVYTLQSAPTIADPSSLILYMEKRIAIATTPIIQIFEEDPTNGSLIKTEQINMTDSVVSILTLNSDYSGEVLIISSNIGLHYYRECKVSNCITCQDVLFCAICVTGMEVAADGTCQQIPVNTVNTNLCDLRCLKCENQVCLECPMLSSLSQNGPCNIDDDPPLDIAKIIVQILSIVRHAKLKSVLFLTGDLWLYSYHKHNYTGTINVTFEVARKIQAYKNSIFQIQRIEFIADLVQEIQKYKINANQKYQAVEDKEDSIPQNITDYLLQTVPLAVLFFLLSKLLFRLLFNYPISVYIRPFALNGFILISVFESNIEFVVFIGLRNLQSLESSIFTDKIYCFFVLLIIFPFVIHTFLGYIFLREYHGKLFKYFLNNLFRVKHSAILMTLIFSVKPFIQGAIHSLLYENTKLQLIFLMSLNFLVFLILACFQITKQIFQRRPCFFFFNLYYFLSFVLNVLMYLNIVYYEDDEIFLFQDEAFKIVEISRFFVLILSCLLNMIPVCKCKKDQEQQILKKQNEENTRSEVESGHQQKQTKQPIAIIFAMSINDIENESNHQDAQIPHLDHKIPHITQNK